MSELRVLVVTESFLPQINGVTNSVRRVLEHLEAEGHEAALIAPTGPAEYAGFPVLRVRGATLPFYRDFRLGLETRSRLRAIFDRFGPDVIHVASPATLGYQAIKVANEMGIPVVAIYQTDLVGFAERYPLLHHTGGPKAAAALTRKIHSKVDRTLVPSTASLSQLAELGIGGTALWPRGCDTELFHPEKRDYRLRLKLAPHGETIVGYVGRLAPEKELGLLQQLSEDPRYSVVLVGGGPEEERLRRLMPKATFLGLLHGEELAAAYASLDIFVHTGRHETFCQSAQEALASGVPVVAPRQGGPIDVVDDLKSGFLYEPGSAEDLTRYVGTLYNNPRLGRRMGAFGRARTEGRSWCAINGLLVGHYREVVAGRRGLRPVAAA
ncbi:glycosyltransferase family 4 protein [Nocardioides sp. Kera G14]|uniref:glycosyltransferase family 4 protein n=1 Tax=Nocardioides sp. Kera G14 TaxID=2884264 RepID=UPI001D104C05|nr:glycosyltransferase family 1 protein [Nocardioides sp. Kera G14]UDY22611.1 glycosyltransferase family 1 protein [Nocardioides sp. Kera G14]